MSDVKLDVSEFMRRFGEFVLDHFQYMKDNESLNGMKTLLEKLENKGSDNVLPVRERELERECNKGNEWACKLLKLPVPVRTMPKREKKPTQLLGSVASQGLQKSKSRGAVEDMEVPGCDSWKKEPFSSIHSPIPQDHLLNFFMINEFLNAFGFYVFGDEREVGCSQLERWLVEKKSNKEFELFVCDILSFIMNESDEPSRKKVDEEMDDEVEEDDGNNDKSRIPFVARFKKLVPHLNPITW